MKFTELSIQGAYLIEPKVHGDDRGFFYETYRQDQFEKAGISTEFIQDNHSSSSKGILRALHFQVEPHAQIKLVRVVHGSAFDVLVDLRAGSKSFGKHETVVLNTDNKKMVYVPAGCAHGFCALEDQTEFLYKVDHFYAPECERGIIWNDSTLNIAWPKLDVDYILSTRDQKLPTFEEFVKQKA
jgi:dTDP-4-dehydrorhamnose 3,5-epimerase